MLRNYCRKYGKELDDTIVCKICVINEVIGYPRCCELLNSVSKKQELEQVFANPREYLREEIEKLEEKDQVMYDVLVLAMLNRGELRIQNLRKEQVTLDVVREIFGPKQLSLEEVRKKAEYCSNLHLYLRIGPDKHSYQFCHDTVHEATFQSFAERYFDESLEHCHIDLLTKFCDTSSSSEDEFCLFLPESHISVVAGRFMDALSKDPACYQSVAKARLWGSETFMKAMLDDRDRALTLCSAKDHTGSTLLVHGSKVGNKHLVQQLVEVMKKEADSTYEDQLHLALQNACTFENAEVVQLLSNYCGTISDEIMVAAAKVGNVHILDILVKKGGNVMCQKADARGTTLLHFACLSGKLDMAMNLVKRFPELLNITGVEGRSTLYLSVIGGNNDIVKHLLELGLDVNTKGPLGQNLLHVSCYNGHRKLVEYFMSVYPQLAGETDGDGGNALHYVAKGGDVSLFQFLVEMGIDHENKDRFGRSVLYSACRRGKETMVRHLVQTYPNMEHQLDKNSVSVVHLLAWLGHTAALNVLMEEGHDHNERNRFGQTILHRACHGAREDTVKYILEKYPYMVKQVDKNGVSVLHLVARGGSVAILNLLLDRFLDLDPMYKDMYGRNMLHWACGEGKDEMVHHLLKNYPQMLHDVTVDGESALHKAAIGGNITVLSSLLEHDLDPKSQTFIGQTVLHFACRGGKENMVKHLLENYPDMLNEDDDAGTTLLHEAAWGGNTKVLELLIDKGLDPKCKDHYGKSILHRACNGNAFVMVKHLLQNYPQLLFTADCADVFVHHLAAATDNIEMLKFLVEKGLDPRSKTTSGRNAIHFACQSGGEKVVKYLVTLFPDLMRSVDNQSPEGFQMQSRRGNAKRAAPFLSSISLELKKFACEGTNEEMTRSFVSSCPESVPDIENDGTSVLHDAAWGGNTKVVSFLLEKGLDPHCKTKSGHSLIHYACANGKDAMTRFLVERFPESLQEFDKSGASALHWAAWGGNNEIVGFLINKGINGRCRTYSGRHFLHYACESGRKDTLRYLLETYADEIHDIELDKNNVSLLHLAASSGNVNLLDLLLKYKLNPHRKTRLNSTLASFACYRGKFSMTKILLERYPDMLNSTRDGGYSLLHEAARSGNTNLLKFLVGKGLETTSTTNGGDTILQIATKNGQVQMANFIKECYPDTDEP